MAIFVRRACRPAQSTISGGNRHPKLMWCASPLTPAYLSAPNNVWLDVPDTRAAVDLPNEAVVLISYDLSVSRIKETRERIGGSQAEEDELGFRVVVDGSPYRESATSVGEREPLVTTASGYLVLELPSGAHDVRLQWRKRGYGVSMWVISSELLDGFVGGRNLVVSAQQRFIWHTQPLTSASLITIDAWEPVIDMAVHFRLSETASVRIFYHLPVRPELINFDRVSTAQDTIEAVLEINGLRYRETGSYGVLEGGSKSTINLQGSIIMTLQPGDYSAILFWKRLPGSTRPWYSSPSALDGFAMGRVLAAVGERDANSISVYNLNQLRKGATGEWSDVGDSILQFNLPTATQVTLSYNLPVAQSDNPQFSSWSDEFWNRIQTRLVVDGVAYRHLSSYVDGNVRGIKNAKANMVVPLPGGTHTARLQWKNVDGNKWTRVSFITDHASSYASVFLSVNAWNNDPKVLAPKVVSGLEDESLDIAGVSIGDSQSSMDLNYVVTIRMSVQHGVLTLKPTPGITFSSGNGIRNEYLLFSGTLSSVNSILSRITYRSYLNWYGNDTLRVAVTDQSSTGYSPTVSHEESVMVNINSVNDEPQIVVPTTQIMLEDEEISIFGVSVDDVDVRYAINDATFEVEMFAISGVLTLASTTDLVILEGDGYLDQFVRFRGNLYEVNTALFEIRYKPNRDFNTDQHWEQIGIRIIDYNRRDGTISEARRSIPIEIQSEDDPVVIIPSEMFTMKLSGYKIETSSNAAGGTGRLYARLQTMTVFGKIQLLPESDDVVNRVTKLPASSEPSTSFELSGSSADVKAMMKSISYQRSPSFVGLSYMSDFSQAEESVVLLALQHNKSEPGCTLSSVSPTPGGTKVAIRGDNFPNVADLVCLFGGKTSNALFLSASTLECQVPSMDDDLTSRQVELRLTTNYQEFSRSFTFTYTDPPIVLSVSPNYGSETGGQVIEIIGEHFFSDTMMACVFNDTQSTVATFQASTKILCETPRMQLAEPSLMVEVGVAVTLDGYRYQAPGMYRFF
uniref:IPT/TIG domain-containing protein n=1 Tax=Globisporangium ultimum (strain ATCC 200006 / CBS 805.95 / DAOM BR144) TaxID=431595 RepID=K3WKI4_GLOUD